MKRTKRIDPFLERQLDDAMMRMNEMMFAIITHRHKAQNIQDQLVNGYSSIQESFKSIMSAGDELYRLLEEVNCGK